MEAKPGALPFLIYPKSEKTGRALCIKSYVQCLIKANWINQEIVDLS